MRRPRGGSSGKGLTGWSSPSATSWETRRRPGRPDRSVNAKNYGDGWDYSERIDHNAGAGARGACVIRVNPMPEGYEEYDWKNGWPLIGEKKVVIYGRGVR